MAERKLSNVAKAYLCRFYEILEQMTENMTEAGLTDSLSHNFIVQMIPHHLAAIEMSENLLQYTTCVPLQNIALNIIDEQTKSIDNMKNILCQCGEQDNTPLDLCLYQKGFSQITCTMFTQMKNACSTNNINADFIREMIPHHEGAIRMSQNALLYDICSELVPILEAIIKSQKKGICEMKKLLQSV